MNIDDYEESRVVDISASQGMVSSNTNFNKKTATESYTASIPTTTGSGIDNLRLSISGQELNRRINVKDALLIDTIPEMNDFFGAYTEAVYRKTTPSGSMTRLYYITRALVATDTIPKISLVLNKYYDTVYTI